MSDPVRTPRTLPPFQRAWPQASFLHVRPFAWRDGHSSSEGNPPATQNSRRMFDSPSASQGEHCPVIQDMPVGIHVSVTLSSPGKPVELRVLVLSEQLIERGGA